MTIITNNKGKCNVSINAW